MKKRILTLLLAVVMVASVVALVACAGGGNSKKAYGLVHGKGYVGQAEVVMDGDKIILAYLDEACLPSYVVAPAASADTISAEVVDHGATVTKIYYKTVKWANVTCTYDATNGYVVDGKKLVDYFADEANCQKYFEAVKSNSVSVVVNGKEDKTILTAAALLKTQNGYWTNASGRGWGTNAMATIAYVIKNGVKASNITVAEKIATDNNGVVVTGATWVDIQDYYALLKAAAGK
jgi:hypothetical protein